MAVESKMPTVSDEDRLVEENKTLKENYKKVKNIALRAKNEIERLEKLVEAKDMAINELKKSFERIQDIELQLKIVKLISTYYRGPPLRNNKTPWRVRTILVVEGVETVVNRLKLVSNADVIDIFGREYVNTVNETFKEK